MEKTPFLLFAHSSSMSLQEPASPGQYAGFIWLVRPVSSLSSGPLEKSITEQGQSRIWSPSSRVMPKSLNLSIITDAGPVKEVPWMTRPQRAGAFWILCVVPEKEAGSLPLAVHKDNVPAVLLCFQLFPCSFEVDTFQKTCFILK